MFKSCFFFKRNNMLEIAKRMLNDIATYHIWKGRCSRSYEGKITPSAVMANEIWVEFTNSIMARINYIKAKAIWWSYRDEVWLVPKAVATLHLEEIEAEQSILLALLLEWEYLVTSKAVDIDKLYSLCPSNSVLRGEHSYNLPPIFATFDPRWKIRTTPKSMGKDSLDVLEGKVAQPAGLQSSSSKSTC
jgi:hypothetical protein